MSGGLENLVGAWDGTSLDKAGEGSFFLQVNRQTTTTLKGYAEVDGYDLPGVLQLHYLGNRTFTVSYSSKYGSFSAVCRTRGSQISGSFKISIPHVGSDSGTFVLNKEE